jgi:hypothetical protein
MADTEEATAGAATVVAGASEVALTKKQKENQKKRDKAKQKKATEDVSSELGEVVLEEGKGEEANEGKTKGEEVGDEEEGEEGGEGGDAKKKKKKKKKKKGGAANYPGGKQTSPCTVPVANLYPDGSNSPSRHYLPSEPYKAYESLTKPTLY